MNDDRSLGEARRYVLANRGKGVKCPCCGQFVKVYRRTINKEMVRDLVTLEQLSAVESYTHVRNDVRRLSHEVAQLSWWGLVKPKPGERDDGGRNGWWRITPKGRLFLQGNLQLPKYAMIFDGQCFAFDLSKQVTVHDAWKSPFDLQQLMGGR